MRGLTVLLLTAWLMFSSAAGYVQDAAAQRAVKAAGCFIPTPDGVIVGIGRFSGAIHVPIGSRKRGERARETAVRETREETGVEVAVGRLLTTFEENSVYLFLCMPKTPIGDYSKLRPADGLEISEVLVLDPITMLNYDGRKITNPWRFPRDRRVLSELLETYSETR